MTRNYLGDVSERRAFVGSLAPAVSGGADARTACRQGKRSYIRTNVNVDVLGRLSLGVVPQHALHCGCEFSATGAGGQVAAIRGVVHDRRARSLRVSRR